MNRTQRVVNLLIGMIWKATEAKMENVHYEEHGGLWSYWSL